MVRHFFASIRHILPDDCYFIRDRSGMEVDLVIENARRISLYEIKAAMSFSPDLAKGLVKAGRLVGDVESSTVVYAGNNAEANGIRYANFRDAFVNMSTETVAVRIARDGEGGRKVSHVRIAPCTWMQGGAYEGGMA